MKIKVIREHNGGGYGDEFEKKVGQVFDVPDEIGQGLVDAKLVEKHTTESKKAS